MANRLVGNVLIIDSAQGTALSNSTFPSSGAEMVSIFFYATDTTGELRLTDGASTANTIIHIRSNQNQPYNFPYYLNGLRIQNPIIPVTVTAGTAFLYFR